MSLVITKNHSEIGLNWFFPKKNFSDCVEPPMTLPPAPPEEGTSRAEKVEKVSAQKRFFFYSTAARKKFFLKGQNDHFSKRFFSAFYVESWLEDIFVLARRHICPGEKTTRARAHEMLWMVTKKNHSWEKQHQGRRLCGPLKQWPT